MMDITVSYRLRYAAGFAARMLALVSLLLGAAPSAAQDVSVLLQSVDNVEKRVNRLEAEIQKLKKAAPGAPEAAQAAPAANASSRLDSLRNALASLEARLARLESPSLKEQPALAHEIADLAQEVKGLAGALRQPSTVSMAPAAPPAALPPPVTQMLPTPPPRIDGPAKPDIVFSGNLQIHGERKLTSASNRDNLDLFWGRANLTFDYKDERLQSKVNVRIFPEGFGFDPLTGASFDTTGQGSLKTQTEAQAKVQINNAWAQYTWPDLFAVRAGRIETHDSPSETFGYYIDGGPSGKFLSRKPTSGHNALEFMSQNSGFSSSLMLAAADRKLDHGYLRIQEKYAHASGFQAAAGYRVNVFDRWKYPDDELLQRVDLRLGFEVAKGKLLFAEAGLLQVKGHEDDKPLLVGFQCPVGAALDLVSVEAEYLSTRQVKQGALLEDKPLLFNFYARKKFMKRLNFDLGFFSDGADPENDAFGMGLRMTSSLK